MNKYVYSGKSSKGIRFVLLLVYIRKFVNVCVYGLGFLEGLALHFIGRLSEGNENVNVQLHY